MTRDAPPESMRAIEIAGFGGPEVLKAIERPVPSLKRGEVLIAVEAAGVSRPDAHQRLGRYPPPPGASDLPGLEVAGTIARTGEGATRFRSGDRVVALLAGGGYAEFCAVPELQVLPMPRGWSAIEAATLPENFFTVWTNLFQRGRLAGGETLLVHGGAGGIGTAAITLGRAFGAQVLTTVGSDAKKEACEKLGAYRAINYRTQDFVAEAKSATGGRGVDVILDIIAGDYVPRDVDALAIDGRLVIISFRRSPVANLDVMQLMAKRLTVTGSTLRPRTPKEKGEIAAELLRHVWPRLEAREITPLVDSVFPLADAAKAHERLESGEHIGKIVLEVIRETEAP